RRAIQGGPSAHLPARNVDTRDSCRCDRAAAIMAAIGTHSRFDYDASGDLSQGAKRVRYCARESLRWLCLAAIFVLLPAAAVADAFYKGKTITFIIGSDPGGGYDTYSRLLAAHIGTHLEGTPRITPQNMPAAGS